MTPICLRRSLASAGARSIGYLASATFCGIDLSMPDTETPDERPLTRLESALRYDRTPLLVLVVLLPLVSWTWIVVMARDMYGPLTGASAWTMTPVWDAPHLLLLWAMWAVMMTGMMLPSAVPLILLARLGSRPYPLAAGYLAVWALFSVGATALQWQLGRLGIVDPMMEM